jgi:uncharacterized protein with NRDE domain
MCLVVAAFGLHANYPLIVAGNRDEFHARPAAPAHWWQDHPDVLGGRDLEAGGTWLGIHRSGRFATVTNCRDAAPRDPAMRSRGHLVTAFLQSQLAPLDFLTTIDADAYAGFNLLVSDGREHAFYSNRDAGPIGLEPGIYGLSNATLDTPWTKVERSKASLRALLDAGNPTGEELLRVLANRERGPVAEVSSESLPFETAHAITAPFIVLPDYGTRCSTIVRAGADGFWEFLERRFDALGTSTGESRFSVEMRVDRR